MMAAITAVLPFIVAVLAFIAAVVLLVRYTTPRCYLGGSRPFGP